MGNKLVNNSYGIYLTSSSYNNTLIGNNISKNNYGIHLGLSFNNTISDNDVFSNNFDGIRLYSSSKNNTIRDNKVTSNYRHGVYLNLSSSNNQIINNEILSNLDDGIHLSESSNDTITENYIFSNNGSGIKLIFSSNNIITKNNISSNIDYGINLSSSSINNMIYHNDFINNNNSNSPQAFDASDNGNKWDDGYPSGGNYWSDFDEPSEGAFDDYKGPDQNISGYDGIIDNGSAMGGGKNPYVIDSNSKDDYPLANPVDKFPPTIMNLFPLDGSTINESTPTISADYSDSSGINISSVMLEVDGIHETANATVTAGNVTFIPSSAFEDGNHTINLEVKDIWGNIASTSWKFVIDTTPPATINDLSLGNITNYSITLTWTAPGDDDNTGTATGYIVKFSTAGPITDSSWDHSTTYNQSWVPLGAGNTETHIIAGLNQGTQYWFAIKAFDEVPNYADISNCPDGTTLTIPTAPQNLQATSGDRYINLTWEVPFSDGGSPITMYNIYRDDKPGVYVMVPPGQFLYRDINVMNGVKYTYNVSAVNIVGEGPKSIGVTDKPMTIPSAPRDLEASAGDGYVNLTWNSPVSDGGSSITNYRIYRGSGPGQKTFLTEIGKILFYNDTEVTNGVTYFYIVSCVNIVGESSFSGEANATPDKDSDGDSIPNYKDWDDDNDGYPDQYDDFPLNASEWLDTDDDGIGNNADPDDDDDGYLDEEDADPLDPNVWKIAEEKGDSDMIWIWFLIAVIIILCIIVLILILKRKGKILGKKVVEEEESELEQEKEINEN
jgi:parallel beta-helix repeat protein